MSSIFQNPKLFPSMMVALSVLSAFRYAGVQDWRHTIYWVASATIIAAVTY